MSHPVLFLDVDGVLNFEDAHTTIGRAKIEPRCVEALNLVLGIAKPRIIVSSSWRYLVIEGAMTVKGFEHLLNSHGVMCRNLVDGITRPDERDVTGVRWEPRANQIADWLAAHPDVTRYAILDDGDHEFTARGMRFVQTDPMAGLTLDDAEKVLKLLCP